MPPPIQLQRVERTNPTLWAHMRRCGLRAALAATKAADEWVLHDPRLWLGTAFHEVMCAVRHASPPFDPSAIWNSAIARLAHSAGQHPLDRRYAAPERWPSYFLVRQRCFSLASQVPQRPPPSKPSQARREARQAERGAERRFEAFGGLLVGRPDYYDGTTITEYKSSLPEPTSPAAESILDGYRRQMRLYGAIIAEATGHHPERARVVAASGQVLEIVIPSADCDAEAQAAINALQELNARLLAGTPVQALASPGPLACIGCPFKTICAAFWKSLRSGEMRELPDMAMEGELQSLEDGPDGDLYTARIMVSAASRVLVNTHDIVLRTSIHGKPNRAALGQAVRVTDFYVRADGRVRADIATVAAACCDLPALAPS
jgi:PD-(D/E)XK nuclease superfamily